MSSENFGIVSTKNIMIEYFKLSNKEDMANAIELFCDEEKGIVFNKHPSIEEEKFSAVYEFLVSAAPRIPPIPSSITASSDSLVSRNKRKASERLNQEIYNSFKHFHNNGRNELNFNDKEKNKFLEKETKETLNDMHSKKDMSIEATNAEHMENTAERIPSVHAESVDHLYDIIAPEGRGKFQKFVGNGFAYVLLEDGTHHCYPDNLLKHNMAYLKKNPLCTLNYNYKDLVLKHTQNILKANKNVLHKVEVPVQAQRKASKEFIDFPENISFLKEYIKNNDLAENSYNGNLSKHLKTEQQNMGHNGTELKSVEDPTPDSKMKIRYQVQKIENYKTVKEVRRDESELGSMCCL